MPHPASIPIPARGRTRLRLPVTLWACCWSEDVDNYLSTLRVLRYCSTLFEFQRVLLFAYLPPPAPVAFPLDLMQIPRLSGLDQWNICHTKIVPLVIDTPYALSVHEDGFPINFKLWRKEFLDYDYVGAPWQDGVVGNGGFCIESRRLLREKLSLPFHPSNVVIASDYYVCRVHRETLEARHFRFAPTDLALDFSTELTGQDHVSFGFHGRGI